MKTSKKLFVTMLAAALTVWLCATPCVASTDRDVIRVESGGNTSLSANGNRNATEKVRINQATQNNTSYENYSNYYDIWDDYNSLFDSVKWEKYNIFDHDGDELPSYSSIPSAKEKNFYIVEQGTLNLDDVSNFFDLYGNLYMPYVDGMSRYESNSWTNLLNLTFNPDSTNNLTTTDYQKFLTNIEDFFTQILNGNCTVGLVGSAASIFSSSNEFGKIVRDRQGREQLSYNDTLVYVEPLSNDLTLPYYNKNTDFSQALNKVFDFIGNSTEGKDIQRWRYLKDYLDFLTRNGREGLDVTSVTEYTISDYESDNVDKTTWYQKYDWNVYEFDEDVNADDNADVDWDVPLYSLAEDSSHSSISVSFNRAGTYYIGCTQNCDLVLSEKITYAFRRYVVANDTNMVLYVTNSFADNDGVYTLWSEKDTEYVTTYTEKNTEYLIGCFAVHITEEDVNRVISFDSTGDISLRYTTERID